MLQLAQLLMSGVKFLESLTCRELRCRVLELGMRKFEFRMELQSAMARRSWPLRKRVLDTEV